MAEEITLSDSPAPEAQEPEKTAPKKRTTITSLKADFKTLESFMDEEIIPAIELIEDRVNKLIAGMKQTPLVETPMLEARLEALEAGGQRTVVEVANSVEMRLHTLEEEIPTLAGNQELFVKVHKQMQEDINVIAENNSLMQDAIIALQEGETTEAPEPRTMDDWIKPEPAKTGHIENMARACVSMSDVLMICRYLKANPEIPEEERIETVHTACQRAGVPVSAGMKARAGVKYIEA